LNAGTQYLFRISAYNGITPGLSRSQSATTTILPAVQSLATGTITNTQVPLTWTAPSSGTVSTYTVEYKLTSAGSYTVATSTLAGIATSYTVTGLNPGLNYTFQVTGYSGLAIGTPASATATTVNTGQVTGVIPSSPTANSIVLDWTAPTGTVTKYKVEYSASGGAYVVFGTQPTTTTTTAFCGYGYDHKYETRTTIVKNFLYFSVKLL
jgi:hypothetical protein